MMPDEILPRRSLLGVFLAAGGSLAAGAAWLVMPTRLLAQTLGQTAAKSPPAAKPTARRRTVVLDPGHGGIDPGAIGLSGAYEKDLALDAARLVAQQLEATKRYRVVLTRTSDEFVPLQDRVARAAPPMAISSCRSMPTRCPIPECAAPRYSPSRRKRLTRRRRPWPRARTRSI